MKQPLPLRPVFVIVLLLMAAATARAQQPQLANKGNVPSIFKTTLADLQAKQAKITSSHNRSKAEAKTIESFNMSVGSTVWQELRNGNLLYGDTMTRYLNRILDVLLKDDPKLRQQLTLFTNMNGSCNAGTYPNGMIAVNVGLLAYCENEAQVAYVLCHEIAHYVKKHSLTSTLAYSKMDQKKISSNHRSRSDQLMARHQMSQKHEFEADEWGFKLFRKSPYSLDAALEANNTLLYAGMPYMSFPVDFSWFEPNGRKIEKSWLPDSLKQFNLEESLSDSLSTHPNAQKRKGKIEELMKAEADTIKQVRRRFVVSDVSFVYVQQLAREELIRMNLEDEDVSSLFFTAWILYQQTMDSKYELAMIKAMYLAATMKNNNERIYIYTNRMRRTYTDLHQLNYFLDAMPVQDANIIALLKIEEYLASHPEWKDVLTDMRNHLLFDLATTQDHTLDFLAGKAEMKSHKLVSLWNGTEEKSEEKGKNHGALASLLAKPDVKEKMDEYTRFAQGQEDKIPPKKVKRRQKYFESGPYLVSNDYQPTIRLNPNHPLLDKEDIKKVVVLNPVNWVVNKRKSEPLIYSETQKRTELLQNCLNNNAHHAGLDIQVLDPSVMSASEDFDLHRYALNIFSSAVSNQTHRAQLQPEVVDRLIKKYNTRYYGFVLVQSEANLAFGAYIGIGVVGTLYFFPIGVAFLALARKYDSSYYFAVADIKNGKLVYFNQNRFRGLATDGKLKKFWKQQPDALLHFD